MTSCDNSYGFVGGMYGWSPLSSSRFRIVSNRNKEGVHTGWVEKDGAVT